MKRYLGKFSRIIIGFSIIYAIYLVGETIQRFFHIPIPGNVIGFLIMFFLLRYGILKEKYIEDASRILISYLVLFFIPYLVKIVTYKEVISKNFLGIILSIFGSYIVLLFASSSLFQYLAKKGHE